MKPRFLHYLCLLTASCLLLPFAQTAPAAQSRPLQRIATIRINDGTTIRGTVTGLQDGIYTIETESVGKITVNAERILGISYESPVRPNEDEALVPVVKPVSETPTAKSAPPPPAVVPPAIGGADMQQMMQQMLGNPEIMKLVEQLSQDPDIQKMVQDPELQKAINGGDYLQLLRNPAVRNLMENDTVKQIAEEVKAPAEKPAKAE